MRRKIFTILVSLILTFSLTGCFTLSQTSGITDGAALSSANFDYINTVYGTASTSYILGLFGGTVAGMTPEQKAIEQLKKTAGLKSNQALTNISVTSSEDWILCGLVIVKKVYASGDIVEFR